MKHFELTVSITVRPLRQIKQVGNASTHKDITLVEYLPFSYTYKHICRSSGDVSFTGFVALESFGRHQGAELRFFPHQNQIYLEPHYRVYKSEILFHLSLG